MFIYFIYRSVSVNPEFPIYPSPPFPFGNHKFVFYVCESYFCFVNKFNQIDFLKAPAVRQKSEIDFRKITIKSFGKK